MIGKLLLQQLLSILKTVPRLVTMMSHFYTSEVCRQTSIWGPVWEGSNLDD